MNINILYLPWLGHSAITLQVKTICTVAWGRVQKGVQQQFFLEGGRAKLQETTSLGTIGRCGHSSPGQDRYADKNGGKNFKYEITGEVYIV